MSRARISDIIALSALSFKVKGDAIKGARGNAKVCAGRLAVYYVARLNKHTCSQIGHMLGDRDHSTVSDGAKSCQDRMGRDDQFRALVDKIAAEAAALPPFVMEQKIYAGLVIPRQFQTAPALNPTKFFKPKPAPAESDFDDDELLSRAVAAHYAGAVA